MYTEHTHLHTHTYTHTEMAGIHGMIIDESAMEMARNVITGKKPGVWATFRFSSNNDRLLGDNFSTSDQISFRENWDIFVKHLADNADDTRYAVVDFQHENMNDNIVRSKLLFVLWAPDHASVKRKLVSTIHLKDVEKKLIHGFSPIIIQANDVSDLKYNEVLMRIQQRTSVF